MSVWDDPNLAPDEDPIEGGFIPCAWCGMSAQVGGTGVCSRTCENELMSYYATEEDNLTTPLPEGIDNADMSLAEFIAKHRVLHSFLTSDDARSKNEYVADMIQKHWMPAFPYEGGSE